MALVFWNDPHIYIYIYIYSHPQTDCFVLSELFSVARHAGRSKPGSKPVQLYVRLSFRPLGRQADHVGLWNFKVFYFSHSRLFTFFIPYRLPECSILTKSFCITLAAAGNSFARVLNPPWGSIYIMCVYVRKSSESLSIFSGFWETSWYDPYI